MNKDKKLHQKVEQVLVDSGIYSDDYLPWLRDAARDLIRELKKNDLKIVKVRKISSSGRKVSNV